ncbi:hypothetical protein WG70_12665 [Burkholderia oklahomensis EO147]|nr:hypothetical protein WG70_12665 [Burkholderia oklahomensis EO147]AOI50014.1 hypothetical protein WI23_30455 [Burkholderia oklahomensis C6786]KUY52975.1 hypothetical protein WG70_14405 [Burkholderia oklahomensis EO147]
MHARRVASYCGVLLCCAARVRALRSRNRFHVCGVHIADHPGLPLAIAVVRSRRAPHAGSLASRR